MHIYTMLVFWFLASLIRNSVLLAFYLLFSVTCFFTVHEHLFKEENSYSVIFPDLNHLSTCGETLDEALSMAVDCLAGYLYWLKQDGETAPPPSAMEQINPADIAKELEAEPGEAS